MEAEVTVINYEKAFLDLRGSNFRIKEIMEKIVEQFSPQMFGVKLDEDILRMKLKSKSHSEILDVLLKSRCPVIYQSEFNSP